jgi:hypothetical protein
MKIDAEIERGFDGADRIRVFHRPEMARVHHGAQADDADVQSGFAKHAIFHGHQDKTATAMTASVPVGSARELFRSQDRWPYGRVRDWTLSIRFITMTEP